VTEIPAFAQPFVVVLLGLGLAAHRAGDAPETPVLTISGKAKATTEATSFYAFTPTVRNSGSGSLQFTVQNKPAWASLGTRHGTLYGKPKAADAGSYHDIIITVSNGETTAQLPAFSINVNPPPSVASR
jgi:hypothetical protein